MSGSAYYLSQGELTEGLGRELAAKVTAAFGGGRFYVPAEPGPECRLAGAIGTEGARRLADFVSTGVGGMWIELPMSSSGATATLRARVYSAARDLTRSEREIAAALGVHGRTVRRARSALRAAGELPAYEPAQARALSRAAPLPSAEVARRWVEAGAATAPADPRLAAHFLGVSRNTTVRLWLGVARAAGGVLEQAANGVYDSQAHRCLVGLLSDPSLCSRQIAATIGSRPDLISRMRLAHAEPG